MSARGHAQAIFVTSGEDNVHAAFGYAVTLAARIAESTKDSLSFVVRLDNPLDPTSRLDLDVARVVDVSTSTPHFSRSESRPFQTLVVAVERADIDADSVLDALQTACDAGTDIIVIASVDASQKPNPHLIGSFDNARIINLPSSPEGRVKIGDIKIPVRT